MYKNTYETVDIENLKTTSVPESSIGEKGSVILFKDIEYKVFKKKCCWSKSSETIILKKVSGMFSPGMNGILGPTGSGKTSLMDVLAGRKDPRFKSGTVLIDGKPQPDNFKCMTGYVEQNDILYGTLTVRESLLFAANLRLPNEFTSKDKNRMINKLLLDLNLTHCSETYIGDEFLRGVSGGERKRTNIGMALINSPTMLFLDEPTTGLDASTSFSVMSLLAKLGANGKTIIFSIHQPKYSIFKLINHVVLLYQGDIVFQGYREDILPYFEKCGFICEPNNNPADFMLDVMTGVEKSSSKEPCDLIEVYLQSEMRKKIELKINLVYEEFLNTIEVKSFFKYSNEEFIASFFLQVMLISKRTMCNILRNPIVFFLQVFVMILMGLIIGAIYFHLDTDMKSGISNRVGVFYFITTQIMFNNLPALEVFIHERLNFIHENTSGYYRTSAYFLSKLLLDSFILRIFPLVCFGSITYWMIGFQNIGFKFLFYLINLCVASITANGFILMVSASVSLFSTGSVIVTFTFVIMLIFGGLLVNLGTILMWISWIKYFSITRYAYSFFLVNEIKDMMFCNVSNGTRVCLSGNNYLKDQHIGFETPWDFWSNLFANLVIYCCVMILAYIELLRMNKYK